MIVCDNGENDYNFFCGDFSEEQHLSKDDYGNAKLSLFSGINVYVNKENEPAEDYPIFEYASSHNNTHDGSSFSDFYGTKSFMNIMPFFSGCEQQLWNDFDNGERHALPTLGTGRCDSIRRITLHVLKVLLTREINMPYILVDCRYSYEYEGGHIINAININTVEQIKEFYGKESAVALIFHCEFSSVRAPFLSRMLRNFDRTQNMYPNLRFPEVYILEGGYKAFFSVFPGLCVPRGYVKMHSKLHRKQFLMEESLRGGNKNKRI